MCLLAAAGGGWACADERYEGVAYARDGDRVLYRETHWRYARGAVMHRLVLYRCAQGGAFARKRVVDSPSATAPDFDFIDGRDGYEEGVFSRDGRRWVYSRKNRSATRAETAIRVGHDSVIDAGFDAMVKRHWDGLAQDKAIAAPFLLPSRAAFVDFKIQAVADAKAAPDSRTLRMSLNTWYGFAVPPLQLRYRRSDRRLLQFQGIATIRDRGGRYQNVRIEFAPDAVEPRVSEQQVQAAAAEPLLRRCPGEPM